MVRKAVLALALAATAGAAQAQEPADETLVVTSLQATYSLASALAEGTSIRVENAPAGGSRMAGQERSLASADLDALLAEADAVVSIERVWREDPLYRAARARNIRVAIIDAARPWDAAHAPVSLIRAPCSERFDAAEDAAPCAEGSSPYVWLSIANGVRMAETIAADFDRLSPQDAARIDENLSALTLELRGLKAEYDARFAALDQGAVFALADEFVYLFADLGLFVDGYFTKEDVLWTDADLAGFEARLTAMRVPVVVHKWEPEPPIAEAVARAGARLVVLDPGDPGLAVDGALDPQGYAALLRRDLDALLAALSSS